MAIIKYGEALGDFGFPNSFFQDGISYKGLIHDADKNVIGARYVSDRGGEIDLLGNDLKFHGKKHVPVSGEVTDIKVLDNHHHLLLSLENTFTNPDPKGAHYSDYLHFEVRSLWHAYLQAGYDGLVTTALAGDDNITGSSNNDYILTVGGNDTIRGGDGDDWIIARSGVDTTTGARGIDDLWGDGGNDVFWFGHDQGHNVVHAYTKGDKIGLLSTDDVFHYNTQDGVYLQFDKSHHPTADDSSDWMFIEGRHYSQLSFYHPTTQGVHDAWI